MKDVIAWRNGIRKVFTARQWDILGTDKYGWVAEPETPKEVAGDVFVVRARFAEDSRPTYSPPNAETVGGILEFEDKNKRADKRKSRK